MRTGLAALLWLSACAARPLEVPRPRSRECRQPARTVEHHAWTAARRRDLDHALARLAPRDSTALRIPVRLAALATSWVLARADACQAAREPAAAATFAARTTCQNNVLVGLDALAARLLVADLADLTRADAGVDELEAALARCDRPAVLALHRAPEDRSGGPGSPELALAGLARALGDGPAVLAAARRMPAPATSAHVQIALAWGTWLEGQAPSLPTATPDDVARAELAVLRLRSRPDADRARSDAATALAAVRTAYGDADLRVIEVHREVARRDRLAGADTDALAAVHAAIAVHLARRQDPHATPLYAALLHDRGELEHLLGDYASAEISHRAALADRVMLLGETHVLTAESQHALANALEARGQLPEAIVLYTRAATILQARLPADPRTARTYNNLGRALYLTRSFADARRFHAAALEIRQQTLGPDHPDTATSLNNLGAVARAEGDLPGAHQLFERAREIRERVLGPDHPYTAISLNNLAEVLAAEGRVDEAVTLHARALAIRLARFGPDHPETARSQHNLGVLRLQQGDREAARELLKSAAETRAARLGPDHPETRSSLEQLRASQ